MKVGRVAHLISSRPAKHERALANYVT